MITLIFAEVPRFSEVFNQLIAKQPPERQQRLHAAFQLLVSSNGLSLEGTTLGRIQVCSHANKRPASERLQRTRLSLMISCDASPATAVQGEPEGISQRRASLYAYQVRAPLMIALPSVLLWKAT